MDAEAVLGAILRGAVGGAGRKSGKKALRYLSGKRHSWLTAQSILAAAGVAWGVYEAATRRPSAAASAGPAALPPLPPPPPLPGAAAPVAPAAGGIGEGAIRLVQLALSAARADGQLSESERQLILEHARQAGAESIVERELASPLPLPLIVAGAEDPALKEDLYRLAYAIVRADESVGGGERIYLARLAQLLKLDASTIGRLEGEVAAGIDETTV
jgi:uncharacterized membrane protein YebE (DUF533 family)